MTDNIKTTEDFKNVSFINLSVENKILKINQIIQNFPSERKVDICESCRNKNGDFKQYNNFLQDTNICSLCFETSDLLNYSILELVEKSGLTADEYYNYVDEESKITYNGLRTSYSYQEISKIKSEKQQNDALIYAQDKENKFLIGKGIKYLEKIKNLSRWQFLINELFLKF
ncbi:hypothetical protein B0A67_24285 [Flavobacterium aquidurense]|uniref:hypothetical protein n=1 Tax=Flavobacterium aquidurense TaxID=362413 RepID=UPI00091B8F65|nr:hypothetical protein [Flavobacterium aquidurense]OXA65576.1 hypothetical protein B0A67_24285 [Flavobacterium aquidurense]SHH90092.1 hypothetical protein SAMN05444481_1447 [Flavobacterium frigidimaris]